MKIFRIYILLFFYIISSVSKSYNSFYTYIDKNLNIFC